MIKQIKISLIFFLLSITKTTFAEDTVSFYQNLDVLESYIKEEKIDSANWLFKELKEESGKLERRHFSKLLLSKVNAYWRISLDSSEYYMLECLPIFKELGDSNKIAGIYNNLGIIQRKKGNYQKALEHYTKSAKLKAELKDTVNLAKTYNNIGVIYWNQKNYQKSIDYAHRSLELKKLISDSLGMSQSYNNIGVEYSEMLEFDSALYYYKKCYEIRKMYNEPYSIAEITSNMGTVFIQFYDTLHKKEYLDSVLYYFNKSKKILSEIDYPYVSFYTYTGLGEYYFRIKNYEKAIECYEHSKLQGTKLGFKKELMDAHKGLYYSYKKTNRFKKALYEFEEFHDLYVDIFNEENSNTIASMEAEFQYENKLKLDSLNFLQQEKIQKLEYDKQIQLQTYITISISIILLVIIIFAIIIANRLKLTREQKVIIQEANEELNQTNEEILAQRDEIERQKSLVDVKNNEILSSIQYAKRIQEAILPSNNSLNKHLLSGFVLYKPKDVVAGDFYWLEVSGDYTFFGVADCTGHGVPGAMVSVVCHGALNRCVREYKLKKPSDILDKTRELVIETFSKSEEQVKDGMDIALCCWNKKTNHIEYAGANNPLYLIKKESDNVDIIKADKQPIGFVKNPKPFTNHLINLEEGDLMYLFTDGYADQFGGPKGKKLGYKKFREMLLDSSVRTLKEQEHFLDNYIDVWMENEEQVDDICLLGIKI